MKFRRPQSIDPRERRQDREDNRQIEMMARCVTDQEMLDALLAAASPEMRGLMLERIRPYLSFSPAA